MFRRFIRLRVRLIWPEVVAIQVFILAAAVVRGVDYLVPPDPDDSVLSVVERTAPMSVWGGLFIAGGVLGLVGMRLVKWPIAAFGHVLLAAGYGAFALGAVFDVLARSPFEGWRTPADWALVFVVIHWGFADAAFDVWREGRAGSAT